MIPAEALIFASHSRSILVDHKGGRDAFYVSLRDSFDFSDIFKAKEFIEAMSESRMEMPDVLKYGLMRKVMISQADRLLGIV